MLSLIPSTDMKRRLASFFFFFFMQEIIHQIYKEKAVGKPIASYQSIMTWGDALPWERGEGARSCTYSLGRDS